MTSIDPATWDAAQVSAEAQDRAAGRTRPYESEDGYSLTVLGDPPTTAILKWPGGTTTMSWSEWQGYLVTFSGIREAIEAYENADVSLPSTAQLFDQDNPILSPPITPAGPVTVWPTAAPTAPPAAPSPAPTAPIAPTVPPSVPTSTPPVPTGTGSGSSPGGGSAMTTNTPAGAALATAGAAAEAADAAKRANKAAIFKGMVATAKGEDIDLAELAAHITKKAGGKEVEIPNRELNIKRVLDAKASGQKREDVIALYERRGWIPEDQAAAFVDGVWDEEIKPADETAAGTTTGTPGVAGGGHVVDTGERNLLVQAAGSERVDVFKKSAAGAWETTALTHFPTVQEYRDHKTALSRSERKGKTPEQLVDGAVDRFRSGVSTEPAGLVRRAWHAVVTDN